MILLDTGYQDLILGRTWFDQLNVQLNPRKRQLVWPATLPLSPDIVKLRILSPEILKPRPSNRNHQSDADRRDQLQNDPQLSVGLVDGPLFTRILAPSSCAGLKKEPSFPEGLERRREYWDRQNNLRAMNLLKWGSR